MARLVPTVNSRFGYKRLRSRLFTMIDFIISREDSANSFLILEIIF
jgi:hypothetical protein